MRNFVEKQDYSQSILKFKLSLSNATSLIVKIIILALFQNKKVTFEHKNPFISSKFKNIKMSLILVGGGRYKYYFK